MISINHLLFKSFDSIEGSAELSKERIVVRVGFHTTFFFTVHKSALTIGHMAEHLIFDESDLESAGDARILVAEELKLVWHLLLDARDHRINALPVTSATAIIKCYCMRR